MRLPRITANWEDYYNQVVSSKDLDKQQRFGNQFIWELARHSVGEELVVYPAFEKYIGGDEGELWPSMTAGPTTRSFLSTHVNRNCWDLTGCAGQGIA